MSGYAPAGPSTDSVVKKKRRGFGLFDSDDEDMSEPEPVPVKFSGDRSGFSGFSGAHSGANGSPAGYAEASTGLTPARNSRNSQLTTPSRSARSTTRHTPYSSTTTRALQRAKRGNVMENEDDQLISDSVYSTAPNSTARQGRRYTMRGALSNTNEDSMDEDAPGSASRFEPRFTSTPSRSYSSTHSTRESTRSPAGASQSPIAKTTWSQWLQAIVPDSVRKPLGFLGAQTPSYEVARKKDIFRTPEQNVDDDAIASIPGSFEKPSGEKKDSGYINPHFLKEAERRSPSSSIVPYERPSFGITPAQTSWTREDSMALTPSRSASRATSRSPGATVSPPINAFRTKSNFIERMKSAKRQRRYDPYGRRSKPPPSPEKDASKELTPEEQLEKIEREERAMKVQREENRYLKRELYKKLGRAVSDDEPMEEAESSVRKDKGKGKAATVEDVLDTEPTTALVPVSPTKQQEKPKESEGALFGAPATSSTEPAFPMSKSFTMEDADDAVGPLNESGSFSETESESGDKENQSPSIPSSPPPPPAPTHRKLPGPAVNSFQPPPMPAGSLFGSAAPQQPIGGFGLGLAPSEPAPLVRQRNQAQRHRPSISSGLRNSETVDTEKENEGYGDKENGESSSSNDVQKQSKAIAQYTKPANAPSSSASALMEIEGNEMAGGKKVDVRAIVAALPSAKINCVIDWPGLQAHGNAVVHDAIKSVWTPQLSNNFKNAFVARVAGAGTVSA